MKRFIVISISFLLLAVGGCSPVKIQEKPVKIAIDVWAGYAYAFIAQEKGFFNKNKVNVELIFRRTTDEIKDLYRNSDVSGIFTVFPELVLMESSGTRSKLVYVVDNSEGADVIIAKNEFNSLADLRGKRIAFEGVNTFSHMFVLSVLERAGISESEVKFYNMNDALDLPVLLDENKVDAGHTWDPAKTEASKKGYKILATAKETPGIITEVLAFKSDFVLKNHDKVKAIVKSLLEALDYLKRNPKGSISIMAAKEGMSEEEMENSLSGLHLFTLKENLTALSRSSAVSSYYSVAEKIIDFFLKRGQVYELHDINEFIDPRFVNELSLSGEFNK